VATTDDGFVVVAPQTTFDGAVADARDRVLIGAELHSRSTPEQSGPPP
jgi:hypothetical protein